MALEWNRGARAKDRDYFNNNYLCFVVFLHVGHTSISCNLLYLPMLIQLLLLLLLLLLLFMFKENSERI